ncbi:MAG: hypothetical protein QOG71_3508 [Pyrinomonadaceae bacterium]|nr:hypothetical protein [Pyrinomonadaceae bacterium]
MPPIKTPFIEGGYYRDRKQGYTVIEINDKGMKIKLDDGRTLAVDLSGMELRARIYTNIT